MDLLEDELLSRQVALQFGDVLGGIGLPSGVRRCSRRWGAFLSFGLKSRMPSRARVALTGLTIVVCVAVEAAFGPIRTPKIKVLRWVRASPGPLDCASE